MKKSIFLIVLICGFIEVGAQTHQELDSAAKEVFDRITFIENQLKEYKKGALVRFNFAPGIVELSGIIPKNVNGDYNGIFYIPDETEITLWKEWFKINKKNFSYANTRDSKMIYEVYNQKMIQIQYEKGKYKYDISEEQLDYLRKTYPEIKKYGH